MRMILNISPFKSAITAIGSAIAGTTAEQIDQVQNITAANTAFQHAAWTIAIVAGLVSVVNGIIVICDKYRKWKAKRHEEN